MSVVRGKSQCLQWDPEESSCVPRASNQLDTMVMGDVSEFQRERKTERERLFIKFQGVAFKSMNTLRLEGFIIFLLSNSI